MATMIMIMMMVPITVVTMIRLMAWAIDHARWVRRGSMLIIITTHDERDMMNYERGTITD